MSNQKVTIPPPELRFKKDDGSQFPDWEIVPLKSIARRQTTKNTDEKIVRVLTNSAVDGILDQKDYFKKDIAVKGNLQGYYIVEENDYVYNPRISTAAPVGPISTNKIGKGVMSPLYTVFSFNDKNSDFYEQYFKSSKWHHYLRAISNTGARHDRMSISASEFMAMPVPKPDGKEQKKIADFLLSIDQLIVTQTKKLEEYNNHKKGLMEQLFPAENELVPEYRFPEFLNDGDWDEKTLEDVATYTKGFAFKSQNYTDKGIRIIRVSDLGTDYIKSANKKIFAPIKVADQYKRYRLRQGEIIITTVGSRPDLLDSAVGRGVYISSDNQGLLNQNLLKLEMKENVNGRFLFSNINTTQYQKFIASISRGNANQANIAVKELLKFRIKIPKLKEQERIADCLSSIVYLVSYQTKKVEALKAYKIGIVQQLFPSIDGVKL
ncbi:restriction endonuclease subunit S [Flavobacterium sp. W21_SRS_FM6]|uniref:restriction endonuclease subunit S n=1 Tax=Flavobacterium sp. W21_SRS_FM6 TaxID=3240268 RepID=UPI003F90D282